MEKVFLYYIIFTLTEKETRKDREDDKSVITSAIDSERLIALITLVDKSIVWSADKKKKNITIQGNNNSYSQDNKKRESSSIIYGAKVDTLQRSLER